MISPFGLIVDRNNDPNKTDVYALVLNNVVVNTIIASYNDILAVYKTYDYCIDITVNGSHDAEVGASYDPIQDTFLAPPPPPVDYVENLRADFDGAIGVLQQGLVDVSQGSLSPINITAAYNSSLNDNQDIPQGLRTLIQSAYQYILNGGG